MKRNPVKNQQQKQTNNYFWFIWYIMIFINFERKMIEQSMCRIFQKNTPIWPNICMDAIIFIDTFIGGGGGGKQTKNTTNLVLNSMENKTKTAILFISNHLD